jgi:melibiose permease
VVTDTAGNSSVLGLRITMTILPIIGLFIAVIYFRKKYILTEEKVEEIALQLKER